MHFAGIPSTGTIRVTKTALLHLFPRVHRSAEHRRSHAGAWYSSAGPGLPYSGATGAQTIIYRYDTRFRTPDTCHNAGFGVLASAIRYFLALYSCM